MLSFHAICDLRWHTRLKWYDAILVLYGYQARSNRLLLLLPHLFQVGLHQGWEYIWPFYICSSTTLSAFLFLPSTNLTGCSSVVIQHCDQRAGKRTPYPFRNHCRKHDYSLHCSFFQATCPSLTAYDSLHEQLRIISKTGWRQKCISTDRNSSTTTSLPECQLQPFLLS